LEAPGRVYDGRGGHGHDGDHQHTRGSRPGLSASGKDEQISRQKFRRSERCQSESTYRQRSDTTAAHVQQTLMCLAISQLIVDHKFQSINKSIILYFFIVVKII